MLKRIIEAFVLIKNIRFENIEIIRNRYIEWIELYRRNVLERYRLSGIHRWDSLSGRLRREKGGIKKKKKNVKNKTREYRKI